MLKTTTKYLRFRFTYNTLTENDFWSNIESEESLNNFFFCKNLKRTEDSKDTGQGSILGVGTICQERIYERGPFFK